MPGILQKKEKHNLLSKLSGSVKFIDQSNAYVDGTNVILKKTILKNI